MHKAVYPGSFDPVTCGHLDIISRAAKCYDQVFVAVFENIGKNCLFTAEERVEMLEEATADLKNVQVCTSDGLLVEYARKNGINVILKGLRAVTDFDYEFKMALMNKKLDPEIETVFMITGLKYLYLSSSLVKEVASYGACIRGLVPPNVERRLIKRVSEIEHLNFGRPDD